MKDFLTDVIFDEVFFFVPYFFWHTTHIEVVKMCHVFLHLLEQNYILQKDYKLVTKTRILS